MRRDFVANVSHEIRTPLTVLSGFVETMSQPAARPKSSARRVLALMAQQTDRMRDAGRRPADAGAARGQPAPPADRWVDVRGADGAVQAERAALSAGRHTHRSFDDAAPMPRSPAPRPNCRARSSTCVSNAVRYTPAAARSRVRWRVAARRRRRVRGARHRHRHRARAPAAADRALLPRRRQPLARNRRHRARPGDRQARGAAPWRRARVDSEPGKGSTLPAGVPGARACSSRDARRRAARRSSAEYTPVSSSRSVGRRSQRHASATRAAPAADWPACRALTPDRTLAALPASAARIDPPAPVVLQRRRSGARQARRRDAGTSRGTWRVDAARSWAR